MILASQHNKILVLLVSKFVAAIEFVLPADIFLQARHLRGECRTNRRNFTSRVHCAGVFDNNDANKRECFDD